MFVDKKIRRIGLIFTLIGMLILVGSSQLWASQIKLRWDKIPEPNIIGYRVFSRLANLDYDYDHPIWEGVGNYCVIDGLQDKTNYYFVVRAVTTTGEESEDSEEIEYDYEYPYEADPDGYVGSAGGENVYARILAESSGFGVGAEGGKSCFIRTLPVF